MPVNSKKVFKSQVKDLLQVYSSYLDPNEKMDEHNLKYVQQYIGKNIDKNIFDVIAFLEDAIDIAMQLCQYRTDHKNKFNY